VFEVEKVNSGLRMAEHFTKLIIIINNVQFQKISILPPQKGLKLPRGRGVLRDQKI